MKTQHSVQELRRGGDMYAGLQHWDHVDEVVPDASIMVFHWWFTPAKSHISRSEILDLKVSRFP